MRVPGISTALIATSLALIAASTSWADTQNCALCQLMANKQTSTSPLSSQTNSLGFNIASILHPTITPPRFDLSNYKPNWNPANPNVFSTSVYDNKLPLPGTTLYSDRWSPAWNTTSSFMAPTLPPMIMSPPAPMLPSPASLYSILNSGPALL